MRPATVEGRLSQYHFAFQIFWDSPFFGADTAVYRRFGEQIDLIHNMWFEMAARGGLFEIFVMLSWLWWVILGLFQEDSSVPRGCGNFVVLWLWLAHCSSRLRSMADKTPLFWLIFAISSVATSMTPASTEKDKLGAVSHVN